MLILAIETSTSILSLAILEGEKVLGEIFIHKKNSHAEKIHSAIENILKLCEIKLDEINLFAISEGPGSYTGLRIGFASLYGICFSLQKPLISVSTLEAMTYQIQKELLSENTILVPMLDAKGMKVYSLISNEKREIISPPKKITINENSFQEFHKEKVLFFGDGSEKCKNILLGKNFKFIPNIIPQAKNIGILAEKKYSGNETLNNISKIAKPFYL